MKKLLLILLGLLFLGVAQSSANHGTRAIKISYKALTKNKYQVSIKLYRDCTGVNLGGLSYTVRGKTNTVTRTTTKASVIDITPTCKSAVSVCANKQSGLGIGIEEHLYLDTVDFTDAPFNSWINNGTCEIRFELSMCCRYQVNNLNTSTNKYSFASLNLCNIKKTRIHQNEGLQNNGEVYLWTCCNNPAYSNAGFKDGTENDSISYAITNVPIAYKQYNNYKSSFDTNYPITAKCNPTGASNCTPIPNANPPIGFYISPTNGDVIFTPSKCDVTEIYVIEAKEWRKDSNNNYVHIGTFLQEVLLSVYNCANNTPPIISSTKFDYVVCAGEKINFSIYGKDFTLNSGKYTDTTQLSWNNGISGATFTIQDTNAREKEAEFEWQTKETDISSKPYYFIVDIEGNACPLKNLGSRAFSVKVVSKSKILSKTLTTICDKLIVDVEVKRFDKGEIFHTWELYDSSNPTVLLDMKKNKNDSFKIPKEATYYVKHQIEEYDKCSQTFWDTIKINPVLSTLDLGKDTTISFLSSFEIKAEKGNVSYLWNTNSTDSILVIKPIELGKGEYDYNVEITNKQGCKYYDSITLTVVDCEYNITPMVSTPKTNYTICAGESIDFNVELRDSITDYYQRKDTTYINYLSSYGNLAILDNRALNKKGRFQWQTNKKDASDNLYKLVFEIYDDVCPSNKDTMVVSVKVLSSPEAQLFNFSQCGKLKLKASLDLNIKRPVYFNWTIKDKNTSLAVFNSLAVNPEYKIQKKSDYEIELILENGIGCKDTLTQTMALIPYSNRDLLGNDRVLYISETLELKVEDYAEYRWTNDSRSNSIKLIGEDLGLGKTTVGLIVAGSNGCQYTDSIVVDVQCAPNTLDIGEDKLIDIWDDITLSSNGDYPSYLWNDNSTEKTNKIEAYDLGVGKHTISLKTTDQYNCTFTDNMELTVAYTTDIKDSKTESLTVYPSPTKDNIYIDIPKKITKGNILLYNLSGKLILNQTFETNETQFIKTENLSNGTYLIVVKDIQNKLTYKSKFIKD